MEFLKTGARVSQTRCEATSRRKAHRHRSALEATRPVRLLRAAPRKEARTDSAYRRRAGSQGLRDLSERLGQIEGEDEA